MRTDRPAGVKTPSGGDAREAQAVVRDQLEELARDGARRMLTAALEEEVEAYLGRPRYGRTEGFRGYRHGVLPRRLTLGAGTVELGVPRVRDIPAGQEPCESKILRKYQRHSDTIDATFMNLFVEGLATRDFEPALRRRSDAARRFRKTRSGVWLMHQVLQWLSRRWRRLKSAHLCPTVPLPASSSRKKAKVA